MGQNKIDKVWICESVGKPKGLGQQAKAKTNKFRIHTIADLQLHVSHHGIPKVHIRYFVQIYDIALQDLIGSPIHISRTTERQKICIFQGMEIDWWKI